MSDTRFTINPKDAMAGTKVPLHLCPDTIKIAGAMAFLEGAGKYGAHNWRAAGAIASVYKSALERHFMAWWNGEDIDPKSGLPHLWKALACITVLIDSNLMGNLTDDRPPKAPIGDLLEALEPFVKSLKELNADKSPRHYSIADSVEMPKLPENLLKGK